MTILQRGRLAGVCVALSSALLVWPWHALAQALQQSAAAGTGSDVLRLQGQKLFQTRCFVCHGMGGKGDGPAAIGLGANPRNFTDPQWQQSTPDERIRKVIREGGEAVGESSAMPPNSDLSEAQVNALLAFLRSLSRL